MTYSNDIVEASIKLYFKLKSENLCGKKLESIIAETFNISISTFYCWLKKQNDKHTEHIEDEEDNNNIKTNESSKKNKVTNEIVDFIVDTIKNNKLKKIKKVKTEVFNKFNVHLSKTTIYNILHNNNLTYKQLQIQIKPFTDRELKLKKMYLRKKINNVGVDNIISVDEMSIHLNEYPRRTWSVKG